MALSDQEFKLLKQELIKKQLANQNARTDSRNINKRLSFTERAVRTLLPKGVERFAETLGGAAAVQTKDVKQAQRSQLQLQDLNQKLGMQIAKLNKEGKDTSTLEQIFANNTGTRFELGNFIGDVAKKTTKEIAGEALETIGFFTIGAAPQATVAKRLATGTSLGATFGAAGGLRRDEATADLAKSTLKGGLAGLAISGALEGIGAGLRSLAGKSKGRAFTKELQPPKKELAKQIENGFKEFGEEVRNVRTLDGKPAYQGSYKQILKQAKTELTTKGDELLKRAKKFDNVITTRNQVAGDVVDQLQNTYGRLKPSQVKQIQFEVSRMPRDMNVTEMINKKRLYDGLIPDSFWAKVGDANVSFVTQVKYILRDNLRKQINSATNQTLTPLNNGLSIAMDVKKLAADQIAKRAGSKLFRATEGGYAFSRFFNKIVDDVFFNPKITTRLSQKVPALGQFAGKRPIRNAARALTIKEAAERK